MEERIIYLNGAFVPESQAKVSVLDSGFNAGDGIYDVTRTFRHKPFKLTEHPSGSSARFVTRASTAVCPRGDGENDFGSAGAKQVALG